MSGANSLNEDLRGDTKRVTRIPAVSVRIQPNVVLSNQSQPLATVGSSNVAACAINPWPNLAGFHIRFHHHNVSHRTKTPWYYWPTVLWYCLLYSSSCSSSTIITTTFAICSNCHHYEPDNLWVFFILTWRCLLKDPINAKPMKHCKKCSYSYHLYHAHLTRQSWDSSTFETRSSHQTR